MRFDSRKLDEIYQAACALNDYVRVELVKEVRKLKCRVNFLHQITGREYRDTYVNQCAEVVKSRFRMPAREPHWDDETFWRAVEIDVRMTIDRVLRDLCIANSLHLQYLIFARSTEITRELNEMFSQPTPVADITSAGLDGEG